MPSLYYFAAWTDSGFLLGCAHQHETVISAVACCNQPVGYVIAVENGSMRELNDAEEAVFKHAMYGHDLKDRLATIAVSVFVFISRFASSS